MIQRNNFLIVLIFVLGLCTLHAQQPEKDTTQVQPAAAQQQISEAAIKDVASTLISPCCWSETVDMHRSPASARVREAIIVGLQRGMTKEEIQAAMVAQYGERILATPKLEGFNYFVFILPIFGLLFGGYLVWEYIIKVRKETEPKVKAKPAAAGKYDDRIEAELEKFDDN